METKYGGWAASQMPEVSPRRFRRFGCSQLRFCWKQVDYEIVSQSRVRRARLSAIKLSAPCQNLMLQGSAQILVPIKFLPRLHKHVLAHPQAAQTTMRSLHPQDGALPAFRDDHHQVHIAVFMRGAPGV